LFGKDLPGSRFRVYLGSTPWASLAGTAVVVGCRVRGLVRIYLRLVL